MIHSHAISIFLVVKIIFFVVSAVCFFLYECSMIVTSLIFLIFKSDFLQLGSSWSERRKMDSTFKRSSRSARAASGCSPSTTSWQPNRWTATWFTRTRMARRCVWRFNLRRCQAKSAQWIPNWNKVKSFHKLCPGFEPGLLDSKSKVLTTTLTEPIKHYLYLLCPR